MDYKQRLQLEHDELYIKMKNLETFLVSTVPSTLSDDEHFLLEVQHTAMVTYFKILSRRLELINA